MKKAFRLITVVSFLLLLPSMSFAAPLTLTHTLSVGSRGAEVVALQDYLRSLNLFAIPTSTGFFGEITRQAVLAFQKAHNLQAVGIVGPRTREALAKASAMAQPPQPTSESTTTTVSSVTPPSTTAPIAYVNATVVPWQGGAIIRAAHHSPASIGPYTAGGVNFNGSSYLSINSLATVNSGKVSGSYWVFRPSAHAGQTFFSSDFANTNYLNNYENAGSVGDSEIYAFNSDYSEGADRNWVNGSTGSWHHVIFTLDITGATPIVAIYVDGASALGDNNSYDATGGTINLNGNQFSVGGRDDGTHLLNGYLADVWIAPGQSLLSGSIIPAGTIAKFRDSTTGKPVDLGADGSVPTGSAPAIFFHRSTSQAASAFGTNNGTGGAFTTIGTLSAAPSNPSD